MKVKQIERPDYEIVVFMEGCEGEVIYHRYKESIWKKEFYDSVIDVFDSTKMEAAYQIFKK